MTTKTTNELKQAFNKTNSESKQGRGKSFGQANKGVSDRLRLLEQRCAKLEAQNIRLSRLMEGILEVLMAEENTNGK